MVYSIYITTKNKKEAEKISMHLLERKLIACANIFPIFSIYRWKGELVKENEFALLAKTNSKFATVEKEIKKVHSYDIPCICKINSQMNSEFAKWVKKETK